MLRDQSRYLQESVASTSPSPAREKVAKTASAFWYIKLLVGSLWKTMYIILVYRGNI